MKLFTILALVASAALADCPLSDVVVIDGQMTCIDRTRPEERLRELACDSAALPLVLLAQSCILPSTRDRDNLSYICQSHRPSIAIIRIYTDCMENRENAQ